MHFFSFLTTIIFSILFISVIHYLYLFFKDNLTTPITKNITEYDRAQQFRDIIKSFDETANNNNNNNINYNTTPINTLDFPETPTPFQDIDLNAGNHFPPSSDTSNMKDTLKLFLKEQLN